METSIAIAVKSIPTIRIFQLQVSSASIGQVSDYPSNMVFILKKINLPAFISINSSKFIFMSSVRGGVYCSLICIKNINNDFEVCRKSQTAVFVRPVNQTDLNE